MKFIVGVKWETESGSGSLTTTGNSYSEAEAKARTEIKKMNFKEGNGEKTEKKQGGKSASDRFLDLL